MRHLLILLATFFLLATYLEAKELSEHPESPLKSRSKSLEIAKKQALTSQTRCMQYVQMNVFEFEECISELLKDKKLNPAERLGINYMAFVGALSAQRFGSQGSQMMAYKFGKATLKLQKQLRFDDQEVCELLPGDCETRIARTKLIVQGSAPKPLTDAEMSTAHIH